MKRTTQGSVFSVRALRGSLIFWTLFIGVGAVGGAVCMLIDPSGRSTGMIGLLPGLQKLPFADTLFSSLAFSGVSLLIVNGLTQLFTFALILNNSRGAALCAYLCGLLLMLWICIQFIIFPFNLLSTVYFIFGLLEALTAISLVRSAAA